MRLEVKFVSTSANADELLKCIEITIQSQIKCLFLECYVNVTLTINTKNNEQNQLTLK